MAGLVEIAISIAIVWGWWSHGFWEMTQMVGPWLVIGWTINLAIKLVMLPFIAGISAYEYWKSR